MNKTIIATYWITERIYTHGVVAIKTDTGGWKAYLGLSPNVNEEHDARIIADYGGKLTAEQAHGFFPQFKIEDYGK